MKVSILCSDSGHPVNVHLEKWIAVNKEKHEITLARRKSELPGGDLLFLVSCSEIVGKSDRAAYANCLVLHASDLPMGRGWSPHIWEIVKGAEQITLSLLEAADNVDSGRIWKKVVLPIPKHALWDEINDILFGAEIDLMAFAVESYKSIKPQPQATDIEPTYYPRRSPEDSRIDPQRSIADQFDQIRVCDPQRFPAFFDLHGHRYKLTLEKIDE